MSYIVEVTANAEAEIAEIFAWISPPAPMTAMRWVERLEEAIVQLAQYPRRGKRTPEADRLEGETRQIVYGDYRVI